MRLSIFRKVKEAVMRYIFVIFDLIFLWSIFMRRGVMQFHLKSIATDPLMTEPLYCEMKRRRSGGWRSSLHSANRGDIIQIFTGRLWLLHYRCSLRWWPLHNFAFIKTVSEGLIFCPAKSMSSFIGHLFVNPRLNNTSVTCLPIGANLTLATLEYELILSPFKRLVNEEADWLASTRVPLWGFFPRIG